MKGGGSGGAGAGRRRERGEQTTKMMNRKRTVTIDISESFEKKECCE